MPLPTQQTTAYDCITKSNAAATQAIKRLAHVAQAAYRDFWGGDTAHRLAHAEALNQFAAATGSTAAAIFQEHAATAATCMGRVPSTASMFTAPPVDMAPLFDAGGMIDLDALATALAVE